MCGNGCRICCGRSEVPDLCARNSSTQTHTQMLRSHPQATCIRSHTLETTEVVAEDSVLLLLTHTHTHIYNKQQTYMLTATRIRSLHTSEMIEAVAEDSVPLLLIMNLRLCRLLSAQALLCWECRMAWVVCCHEGWVGGIGVVAESGGRQGR